MIHDNFKRISDSIQSCLREACRELNSVKIIAVSKTHPIENIQEAMDCGITCFGENKIQEADLKISQIHSKGIEWHFIGHIQTNKASKAVELFSLLHGVDRPKLVHRLNQEAEKQSRIVSVLLQLNLSNEETKSGARLNEFDELLESAKNADYLQCRGLMTIPPPVNDPEDVRRYFRRLRDLSEEYKTDLVGEGNSVELSMGMSNDYCVAIEEGATMVRIGSSIFGPRVYT